MKKNKNALKKNEKFLDIAIIILSISTLILGVLIYKKSGYTLELPQISLPNEKSATQSPAQVADTPQALDPELADLSPSELSQKLMSLSDFGPNQMKENWQIIQTAAIPTQEIIISDCQGSPLAARVAIDSLLTFTNNDTVKHSIKIDDTHTYSIEPNASESFTVDLQEKGLYAYSCDNLTSSPKSGGILFTTL